MRCDRHGDQPGAYCFLCEGQRAAAVDRRQVKSNRAEHDLAFLPRGLKARGVKRWLLVPAPIVSTRSGYGDEPVLTDEEPPFNPSTVDWSVWR